MKPKILGLLDVALLAGPMAENAGYVAATWGDNSIHVGLGLAGLGLSLRRRAN